MDQMSPLQQLSEPNGSRGAGRNTPPGSSVAHPHATIELLKYLRLLGRHLWLIVGLTVGVMALSVTYNVFFATHLYQAQAVITPVPPDQDMSLIGGGLED